MLLIALLLAGPGIALAQVETWRDLTVAPEHRCSPYDRSDYRYPKSIEQRIVEGLGEVIWSPDTGEQFSGTKETDIEHIVATSEAHDSDLCAHGVGTRRDLLLDCKPTMLYIASQAIWRMRVVRNVPGKIIAREYPLSGR